LLLSRLGAFPGLPLLLARADDDGHRRQLWPRLVPPPADDRPGSECGSHDPARWLGRPDGAAESWEPELA
jgi:hypothetical protein